MQSFGQKIRAFRQNRGKLLRQAAADLEIDQAILSKLENGILLPNTAAVAEIERILQGSLEGVRDTCTC